MCQLKFRFANLLFSKSACKNVPLACEREQRRPIRHIFHRFQRVPASCEPSFVSKSDLKPLLCNIAKNGTIEVTARPRQQHKRSTTVLEHVAMGIAKSINSKVVYKHHDEEQQ